MADIFEEVEKNKFSYKELKEKSIINIRYPEKEFLLNVVIGFRGRKQFHRTIIESFMNAFQFYQVRHPEVKDVFCLTMVEHSKVQESGYLADMPNVNYIWSPGPNWHDGWNRGFAFNVATLWSNKAKWMLLQDLDILVKANFFEELFSELKENTKVVQPFRERHVWYLNKELTDKVLHKNIDYNMFKEGQEGITAPAVFGSKGGSILIARDLFMEVGGFDSEIFAIYAPEDQLFWAKIETVYGDIQYSEKIDMFHMWHEALWDKNPGLREMDALFEQFKFMNKKDRVKFIEMKKNNLNG